MFPLKAVIDKFLSKMVFIPYISCSHANPLVIVHKKEGGTRIAVDYRDVNQFLRESTAIPRYVVSAVGWPRILG